MPILAPVSENLVLEGINQQEIEDQLNTTRVLAFFTLSQSETCFRRLDWVMVSPKAWSMSN